MAFKLLRSNLALTLPQTRPRATLLPVSVRLLSTRPRKQWQLHEPHQISYEQGLPKDSTVSRFNASTLGELLEKATLETPEKTLFIVHHQNLAKTYQQFNDDVDQLAKGLLAIGCRRGDPVGIWAVNSYEWLLVQFATAKIGVIFVTINPGYKAQELVNCINLVGLKTLISNQHFRTSNYVETLNTVSPSLLSTAKGCKVQSKELPSLENLIFMDEAEETAPSNVMRFSELLDKGAGDKKLSELIEPKERTTFDDVINVQFTSGTTGTPKGAMLNHSNIVNNAHFLAPRMYEGYEHHASRASDPIICVPNPLYHCFGCVVGSTMTVFLNGTMVLPNPIPTTHITADCIEQYSCNYLYGTPTMWTDLIALDSGRLNRLTSLRRGVMSGAPCPPSLVRKVISTLPSMENILIPYGATELSPVVTMTSIRDSEQRQAETVGRPLDYVEVKVVDPVTRQIVPRGERGEVCIRGHCTFPGYFKQEDRTKEVLDRNGWYSTGDIGHLDNEGYLSISGRIKEMIIRGGENIYPREVEETILQHPSVEDVHVVGVPDKRFGEEVAAYVKLKQGVPSMTAAELKEYLKPKVSHFKIPRYYRFVDDYPRTVTGKVRKVELKEIAAKEDFSKD